MQGMLALHSLVTQPRRLFLPCDVINMDISLLAYIEKHDDNCSSRMMAPTPFASHEDIVVF